MMSLSEGHHHEHTAEAAEAHAQGLQRLLTLFAQGLNLCCPAWRRCSLHGIRPFYDYVRTNRTCLELAHDGHDRLAGAQKHLPVGRLLHHRHLLIDNAEEVHCSRRPQLPILLLLGLPA